MAFDAEIERVRFSKVATTQTPPRGQPHELWDAFGPDGSAFARIEVFFGETQWGLRIFDRAPVLGPDQLLLVAKRFLVWELGSPADTVEVVLARDRSTHLLVNTGGDYV
jgi:hypothetical protein